MSYIEDAFDQICKDAKPSQPCYVSLYTKCPYYGGPEEGGWHGYDVILVKSQGFDNMELAESAKKGIEELAEQLSQEARTKYGEYCLNTMEFLDARGLDADFLPEPDGPEEYFVVIEDKPGESASFGPRHYE